MKSSLISLPLDRSTLRSVRARLHYPLLCLLLFSAVWGCTPEQEQQTASPSTAPLSSEAKARDIIGQAMEAHGSSLVDSSEIAFDFRDRRYRSQRQGGQFRYERAFVDSTGAQVLDLLTNEGLSRTVDGQPVALSTKDSLAYAESVNSVLYFTLLPYFLGDEAVQPTYLGEASIKGQPYHKVSVTFRQEGGGIDYEDEYVYWIHRDRHSMDYLAYSYQVNDGGARFREAYQVREVAGLRVADYRNYKPEPLSMAVASFDSLFEAGALKLLSTIEVENVKVSR